MEEGTFAQEEEEEEEEGSHFGRGGKRKTNGGERGS